MIPWFLSDFSFTQMASSNGSIPLSKTTVKHLSVDLSSTQNLSKLKILQLRSELKKRDLPSTGNKDLLVKRLREAVLSEDNVSTNKRLCTDLPFDSVSESVNCKCGSDEGSDEVKLMLQCLSCNAWSHAKCYGFSEASAEKVNFLCLVCASDSNLHACNKCTVIEKSLSELQVQVNALSRSLNSHILSLRDDLIKAQHPPQRGQNDVPHISSELARIHDNLNVLNHQVDDLLTSSHVQLSTRHIDGFHNERKNPRGKPRNNLIVSSPPNLAIISSLIGVSMKFPGIRY